MTLERSICIKSFHIITCIGTFFKAFCLEVPVFPCSHFSTHTAKEYVIQLFLRVIPYLYFLKSFNGSALQSFCFHSQQKHLGNKVD